MYGTVKLLPIGNRLTYGGAECSRMTYEDIVVSVENSVATIAINRPENANKLRFQTARELLEALRHVRETADDRRGHPDRSWRQVLLHRRRARRAGIAGLLERDARHRPLRVHRHHAEAGHRRGQRLRRRRRQRPPRRVRPRGRRAARRVPASRTHGRELRRRLRHVVSRGDHRPPSRQGDVVPQPQVLRRAGARHGTGQRDRRGPRRHAPRRLPRPSASAARSRWRR